MTGPISANAKPLPPSYKKWSWGAALLNVVWGVKHGIDVALLTLVPVLGLFIPILLGVKGNQWAWDKGGWADAEQFENAQRNWAFWGFVTWFFLFIVLFIPILFGVIHLKWQHSSVCQDAMREFVKIEKIQTLLGEPIRGRVNAVKKLSPERAWISVRLRGSQTTASVRFHLMKINGDWAVYRMTLFNANGKTGIDFPLSPEMLNHPNVTEGSQDRYDVLLKHSGDAAFAVLSGVLCDLDGTLHEKDALDMIGRAPVRILAGVSQTAGLKIKRKLEDYGAVVEIEKAKDAK